MMLRHLAIGSLIYLALAIQPGLPVELSVAGSRPWIPGIVLVLCLVMAEGSEALIWSSLLGLGVDCLSGERLGVHVVVTTVVATGLLAFKSSSRFSGPIAASMAVLGAIFLWKLTATGLRAVLGQRAIDWPHLAMASFGDAVYSALLVFLVQMASRAVWASLFPERLVQFSILNRWSRLTSE